MQMYWWTVLLLLSLALLIGLAGVFRQKSTADRVMAAQLLGTSGIGILLVLRVNLALPALIDVALVLAVLAVLVTAVLTRRQVERRLDD